MTAEVREIPPAPRTAHWRAVLFRRWGLALLGLLLAGFGSLLTWMLWFAATSSHHAVAERILAGATVAADGTVTAVSRNHAGDLRIEYRFRAPGGAEQAGSSWFAAGAPAPIPGSAIGVEFAPSDPLVSRVRGGRVAFIVPWYRYGFAMAVLPGSFALLAWLCAIVAARRMLGRGDVAVAESLDVREIPWLVPTLLEVRFRFRDRQARLVEGRHVVAARSSLGQRVVANGARVAVVHDRERPRHHQLVVAEDFARA
ncbi:MAG: hypothetical protein IT457_13310 [Planctomycetes bacterium]|nr:hypothetical protein [Planctomycetota bacterium]